MGAGGRMLALTMQEVAECRQSADLLDQEMRGGVGIEAALFLYSIVVMHVLIEEWYVPALELVTSPEVLDFPRPLLGCTIMAAGNCLPELSMALVALLLNGSQDIGTGEVFGSCVFDLLAILGVVCIMIPGRGVAQIAPSLMLYFVCWAALVTAADASLFFADVETTWPASMTMVALYVVFVAGVFACHRFVPGFLDGDEEDAHSPSEAPALSAREEEEAAHVPSMAVVSYGSAQLVAGGAKDREAPADGAITVAVVPGSAIAASANAGALTPAAAPGTIRAGSESTPLLVGPPRSPPRSPPMATPLVAASKGGDGTESKGGDGPPRGGRWLRRRIDAAFDVLAAPPRMLFQLSVPHAHVPLGVFGGRRPWPITLTVCIGYTLALSYGMVAIASRAICLLGVRKNSLGATVLSLSAGLPDLLTATILVKRPGMIGMAVANPFGALLFNGLVALGLPWLILGTYADVFPPAKGTWYPALIGFAAVLVALVVILVSRLRLTRSLGVVLLLLYVAYLAAIIHDGFTRPARPPA